MADILPPAPVGSPFGSYTWADWYQKVRTVINAGASINHNTLTGLQGGGGGDFYHLSASQYAGLNTLIADDWVYLKVTTDYTTSSTTPVDIPGLAFTPAPDSITIVEGMLLLSSSSTTLGIKPGVSWPIGIDHGAAKVSSTNGTNTDVIVNVTSGTTGSAPGTDMPTADDPYLTEVSATMKVSSTPSGQFSMTISAE